MVFEFLDFGQEVIVIVVVEILELLKNSVDLLNFEMDVVDVVFLLLKLLGGFFCGLVELIDGSGVVEDLTLNVL